MLVLHPDDFAALAEHEAHGIATVGAFYLRRDEHGAVERGQFIAIAPPKLNLDPPKWLMPGARSWGVGR